MKNPDDSAPPPKPPTAARPLRIVSVDDEDFRLEIVAMTIARYFKGVTLKSFRDAEEAWQELLRSDPDLLITDDMMGKLNADELVGRLADRKVAYPIIVINAYGPERDGWVLDYAKRGVPVTMMHAPYSIENLVCALETALRISRDPKGLVETGRESGKTRPLRIVQVNDESFVSEAFAVMIRHWFPDATVISFDNGVAALEELSRTDPDLLITDDKMPRMSGGELCQRLLERRAGYPIIVNSPWAPTEQWVDELAGRGLNVCFLAMPCELESLQKAFGVAGLKIPPAAHQKE